MASKHPSHLLNEEEEEEEEMEVPEESEVEGSDKEEEEEGSDTDEDNIRNSPHSTPRNQSSDESSEKEEGFESDEDITKTSPTASSFIVKPAVHKNNHPEKTTVKRTLIDAEMEKVLAKKTKFAKDRSEDDREGTTKRAGRVWSEDDEISILAGMIDFKKEKDTEPQANMGAFLEYVKKMFGFEVTRTQLYEKVRRLKGKFFANLNKGEKFIPTKAHDLKCFKLSKKIWDDNNVADSVDGSTGDVNEMIVDDGVDNTENVNIVDGVCVTKKTASECKSSEGERKEKVQKEKKGSEKNKKQKMEMNDGPKIAEPVTKEDVSKDKEYVVNNYENAVKDNGQNISLEYPNLGASFSMYTESQRKLMMDGICLVDREKARELDDCWKQLSIKETEFHCRRMELLAEQSRLVVDAWKKKW